HRHDHHCHPAMNLLPRAVALQGIGFSPRLVAVQGLRPFDDVQKPDIIPYGRGGMVFPEKTKKRRKDRDDDVLMFLLR
ncbi:MAG: hypothetical protein ACO25M_10255, partial [Limnohabitans sp.]